MRKLVVMYFESEWYSLNINNFNEYNTSHIFNQNDELITFQITDLISHFKSKKKKSLPAIIDLESFDKQMSQEGKEFKSFKKWTPSKFLKRYKLIDNDFKLTKSNFKIFLEKLADIYLTLLKKDSSEKERFESIELKINELIYRRQLLGVRVNIELAKEKCQKIEKQIYNIKNRLQFEYKIYTPDDKTFQSDYLKRKDYKIIKSLEYTFKTRRKTDSVCNFIYDLSRKNKDLNSLLHTTAHFGGSQYTHPWYVGFGTITSRITLRQPALQNLKKENRDIIIPEENMKLLYIDYSQFEAGILASLSKDNKLINLYNTDIYTDLAEKVLDDKTERSEAKILFYRYMYGDDTLNDRTKAYFKEFKNLDKYKRSINSIIRKENKVGTINGNFRYKKQDEEESWALSHKIQSTASLIYKNALITTRENVSDCDFLVPLHDGTLYQIPISDYDEIEIQIKKIYETEFKKLCPQIDVRTTTRDFF